MKPRFIPWPALAALSIFAAMRVADARIMSAGQFAEEQRMFAREQTMRQLSEQPGANDAATLRQLAGVTLANVHWENIPAQAAIADLAAKIKWADPRHLGIKLVVQLPADPKQVDWLGRTVTNNVCVILREPTSALELLNMIGEQTSLAFQVHRGIVTLKLWSPGAIPCVPATLYDDL